MAFGEVMNRPLATTLAGPVAEESCMHQPKPVREGSMPKVINAALRERVYRPPLLGTALRRC